MTLRLDHTTPEPSIEYIRRGQIIEAAIVTISELGYMNTTLLQIARRGHVSAALISHYFQDKNGLMQEVFRRLVWRVQRSTRQRLGQAKTPYERVEAVIDANLTPEEFDHHSSVAWLAFWGQVVHVPAFRRIQSIYQARMLSTLSHALREIVPLADVRKTAIAIAALIDGIWLRSTLSDGSENNSASARLMVRDMANVILAARAKAAPAPLPPLPATIRNFINGGTQQTGNARSVALYNPATTATLARLEQAGKNEIDQAISASQSALAVWSRHSGAERGRILAHVAKLVREHATMLARLHALETGQAARITRETDILPGADWLDYLAAAAVLNAGAPDTQNSVLVAPTSYQPLGILLETGDGFYPFQNACRKIASALAFGNTLLFNTATQPVCMVMELAKLCTQAGVPDGVLNILHGPRELTLAPYQHAVLKTPPHPRTPKSSRPVRASFLVLKDADAAKVTRVILEALLRPEGQRGLRVFADPAIQTSLLTDLKQSLEHMIIGDPTDDKTDLGCLMSNAQRLAFQAHIKAATLEGATLLAGGTPAPGYHDRFMRPALLFIGCDPRLIPATPPEGPVIYLLNFTPDDVPQMLPALEDSCGPVCLFAKDLADAHALATRLPTETCLINPSAIPVGLMACDSLSWLEPGGPRSLIMRYSRPKTIYAPMAGSL